MRFSRVVKRNDYFRKLVATYLGVMLLAILIALTGYSVAFKVIEKDIRDSNLAMLKQSQTIVDQKISSLSDTLYEMATNRTLLNATNMSDDNISYLMLRDSVDTLKSFRLNIDQSFVYDYFIYLRRCDQMIMSDTSYSANFYYENEARSMTLSYHQWLKLMAAPHRGDFSGKITATVSNQRMDYLMYMLSLPMGSDDPDGNAAIIIKLSGINALFSDIDLSNGGWIYIEDANGNILTMVTKQTTGVQYPKLKPSGENGGFVNRTINGKKMIVISVDSQQTHWKYVIVLPQKSVMNQLITFQKTMAAFFIFFTLAYLIVAFYLAYSNSLPVSNILETLKEITGEPESGRESEAFNEIQNSISRLVDRNQNLKERIEQQQPVLLANFTEQLLNGDFHSRAELEAYASSVGIQAGGHAKCVALLLRIYGRDEMEDLDVDVINELNLVRNVLAGMLEEQYPGHVLAKNMNMQTIAVVMWFDSEPEDSMTAIRQLYEKLNSEYHIRLFMGIGGWKIGLLTVWKSYMEAAEALDYIRLHPKEPIRRYSDIAAKMNEASQTFFYPPDYENKLINYTKCGDLKQLEELLLKIRHTNRNERSLSLHMAQQLFQEFVGTLLKISELVPEELHIPERIESLSFDRALEDHFDEIVGVFTDICRKMACRKNHRSQHVISQILEYIHRHYAQPELSLSLVATRFKLSESYLSFFFKKQTGRNFMDYIESYRMEKAQELLTDTDLSIKEIYGKVGYNSAQSFRRAYKRLTGVTPNSLRERPSL